MLAVAQRERNRLKRAEESVEVGRCVFSGVTFGGEHTMRILHRGDEPVVMLEIDGTHYRPRSYRGVLRLLARRLVRCGKAKQGTAFGACANGAVASVCGTGLGRNN